MEHLGRPRLPKAEGQHPFPFPASSSGPHHGACQVKSSVAGVLWSVREAGACPPALGGVGAIAAGWAEINE